MIQDGPDTGGGIAHRNDMGRKAVDSSKQHHTSNTTKEEHQKRRQKEKGQERRAPATWDGDATTIRPNTLESRTRGEHVHTRTWDLTLG